MRRRSTDFIQRRYSRFKGPITVPSGNSIGLGLVKNQVLGKRLSAISFSRGTVNFITDQSAPRLDLSVFNSGVTPLNDETILNGAEKPPRALKEIQIDNGNNFCKTFLFTTSYFTDNNIGDTAFQGNYGISQEVPLISISTRTGND